MSDEVLERYIRHYIESQPTREVTFSWQGGEPTLLGVAFFEKVVRLQQRYAAGRQIANAFQTNGILLDDEWGRFLHRSQFLVGISIDGPRHLHDIHRVDRRGRPTFDRVCRGLELLKRHRVEFNTLTVVSRANVQHPKEVYRFLKGIGSRFIQFIPLVERSNGEGEAQTGCLGGPPQGLSARGGAEVTDWSVPPADYGSFLAGVFRHWVKHDVGRVYVQTFDAALGSWIGAPPAICVVAPECGNAIAMEHNGDVYACDHYVYPEYRLGNIMDTDFAAMIGSPEQRSFGRDKSAALPGQCRECRYRFACHGGCPKHRFVKTRDGEPGLNYLCAGYRKFFRIAEPYLDAMRELYQAGRPPAKVMKMRIKAPGP